MNNGMKVISVITSFIVIALLVQIAHADNQTNSTRMKIYVTNLTITKSWSINAVENRSANLNYSQEISQPNLAVGLLLVMVVASLIILMLAQILRRMKVSKARRKHKSKFFKRQDR